MLAIFMHARRDALIAREQTMAEATTLRRNAPRSLLTGHNLAVRLHHSADFDTKAWLR